MRIVFTVALALATHVLAVTADHSSAPPSSVQSLRGEIVFQSDREGPSRLFIIDVATKAQRRVGSAGDWMDEEPAWSRDGRRIAFRLPCGVLARPRAMW